MKSSEKQLFLKLFNRGGYVLDFSNASFDQFTLDSIGIAIQSKYQLSKGKSLECFVNETNDDTLYKLLNDLLEHYEFNYVLEGKETDNYKLYERCKSILSDREQNFELSLNAIKSSNQKYIIKKLQEAKQDLINGKNDSLITKSRTIIEEALIYAIEKKGETPSTKGDITELYKQVKTLYKMNNDKAIDKRVNELLSGLNKIVDAISAMRNEYSDSHGVGKRRIEVDEHTARLILNSSLVFSEYIIDIANRR